MKIQKRWSIFFFDFLFYLLAAVFILVVYPGIFDVTTPFEKIIYMVVGAICIFIPRFLFHIYQRIWRYAGPTDYLWLVISDFVGLIAFVLLRRVIPGTLTFVRAASLVFLGATTWKSYKKDYFYGICGKTERLVPNFLHSSALRYPPRSNGRYFCGSDN